MDIIESYNNAAEEYARSRIGIEDRGELERLRSLLKLGDRVLDVGCAAGRDTRILKDMGFRVVGTDLAERLLDIARQTNPNIEFVLADMRRPPFADESFQAVWASAVLHHVERNEMPGVLKEFWRTLATDGILYILTKAGRGLLRTNENSVSGETREFELVTVEELDFMLQSADYKKISLEQNLSKSRPGLYWAKALYRK